jgi:hypothetical protein
MNEGFPKHYEVLPAPIERVLEVAQRFGRFLFTTPEVHPYMSEHFRPEYPPEPLDGEAMTKQDTAAYYVAMAKEAAE